MKPFLRLAIVAAALSVFGLGTQAAFAARLDNTEVQKKKDYAQRKIECRRQAKAKNFGVHFIQRNRWVTNCIAGHRS